MVMEAFTSRSYSGVADLARLIDFLLMCRAIEGLGPWPPLREIRRRLRVATPQVCADTRLWEDQRGDLLAFATLWDGDILVSCVHPRGPREDLLAHILAWGQAREQQWAQACGYRSTLCVPIRSDDRLGAALLERQGFVPEAWQTLRMARRLDMPLPPPFVPPGFTVRSVAGEQELAEILVLQQAVFVAAASGDDRPALMSDPSYCADLDLVAVAPDGTLVAFCLCTISAKEDRPPGHTEGWIELIGTHPRFGRHGLARALLLTGLERLKCHGMDTVVLGTTSWNVAAQQLFTSAGFRAIYRIHWYIWEANASPLAHHLQQARGYGSSCAGL
jgi:ribosomal protein S18 acetylase RimI-like enzyme